MALLHEATISPRKDELIEPWLRTRSWWDGVAERGPVASFRLDDPAGQVGMECFLFGSAAKRRKITHTKNIRVTCCISTSRAFVWGSGARPSQPVPVGAGHAGADGLDRRDRDRPAGAG